jgi:RNA polymerase sigma factor (sigma-70 family)
MPLTPDDFSTLYDRHGRRLVIFFQGRTYDAEAAIDLMAETFAVAFRDRAQYRGTPDDAAGWLYGIARHQLSGYFRRGSVERRAVERMGVARRALTDAEIERIDELAGTATLRAELGAALTRLPSEQRDALELRVVQECSYAEVARRLAVSEPTARQRVSRALRALALLIDQPAAVKEP